MQSNIVANSMQQSYCQDKFTCFECGAAFFNRGHMKAHMKQGHPNKPMIFGREDLKTGKVMIFDETPEGLKAQKKLFQKDESTLPDVKETHSGRKVEGGEPNRVAATRKRRDPSTDNNDSTESSMVFKKNRLSMEDFEDDVISDDKEDGNSSTSKADIAPSKETPLLTRDGRILTTTGHSFKIVSGDGANFKNDSKSRDGAEPLTETFINGTEEAKPATDEIKCRKLTDHLTSSAADNTLDAKLATTSANSTSSTTTTAWSSKPAVKSIRLTASELKALIANKRIGTMENGQFRPSNERGRSVAKDSAKIPTVLEIRKSRKPSMTSPTPTHQLTSPTATKTVPPKAPILSPPARQRLPSDVSEVDGTKVIRLPAGKSTAEIRAALAKSLGVNVKVVKVVGKTTAKSATTPKVTMPTTTVKMVTSTATKTTVTNSGFPMLAATKTTTPNNAAFPASAATTTSAPLISTSNTKIPKKNLKVPLDSLLTFPENRKYLHPRFQPVVRCRRIPAHLTRGLLEGRTLVDKTSRVPNATPSLNGICKEPATSTNKWMNSGLRDKRGVSPSPIAIPKDLTIDLRDSHDDRDDDDHVVDDEAGAPTLQKCCPVCMASYGDLVSLRVHIREDHKVEPFGYVEMNATGTSSFLPFEPEKPDRNQGNESQDNPARKRRKLVKQRRERREAAILESRSSQNSSTSESDGCDLEITGEIKASNIPHLLTANKKGADSQISSFEFTCPICLDVFSDLDYLRNHATKRHKATKFSYMKKDVSLGTVELVNESVGYDAHGTSKFDYFCPFCKCRFFSVSGLRQHCDRIHGSNDFSYSYRDPATGQTFESLCSDSNYKAGCSAARQRTTHKKWRNKREKM